MKTNWNLIVFFCCPLQSGVLKHRRLLHFQKKKKSQNKFIAHLGLKKAGPVIVKKKKKKKAGPVERPGRKRSACLCVGAIGVGTSLPDRYIYRIRGRSKGKSKRARDRERSKIRERPYGQEVAKRRSMAVAAAAAAKVLRGGRSGFSSRLLGSSTAKVRASSL